MIVADCLSQGPRIVPSLMSYDPDLRRLEARSDRLVLAGGRDSRGELPYRPAAFPGERCSVIRPRRSW
ncbi:hypothetical protein B4N89_43215 [Embleya scabrispora]|uniref:Uncharacterized protein n=1 Tax=Embleya scabrispora TaxID=159449 RepID=A0A1T3NKG5_9ACTN|nr:hypothetical protein B4N89_43215 [Embleya scabrispora]